jgi:hypothetical protein
LFATLRIAAAGDATLLGRRASDHAPRGAIKAGLDRYARGGVRARIRRGVPHSEGIRLPGVDGRTALVTSGPVGAGVRRLDSKGAEVVSAAAQYGASQKGTGRGPLWAWDPKRSRHRFTAPWVEGRVAFVLGNQSGHARILPSKSGPGQNAGDAVTHMVTAPTSPQV